LVVGAVWWAARTDRLPAAGTTVDRAPGADGSAAAGATGQAANPPARLFAIALVPAGVRGAADDGATVVPADATTIALSLQGDGERTTLVATRASIRLVSGREVWAGPVRPAPPDSSGVLAYAEVPASQLPPDDYVVTLSGADSSGVERDWQQYFLRSR
jgi:hypothetical protein